MTVRSSLTASMLGLLLISAVQMLFASGYVTSYTTDYTSGYAPEVVYKSVDSAGKVTYSTSWPKDIVAIEEVAIKPDPSKENVEASRQRQAKIRETALSLTQARNKRDADREEEEKKRLEKLAMQRSARPQVYEKKVYIGWSPIWWPRHVVAHAGKYPDKYPSHHAPKPYLSHGIPLRSGTSLR